MIPFPRQLPLDLLWYHDPFRCLYEYPDVVDRDTEDNAFRNILNRALIGAGRKRLDFTPLEWAVARLERECKAANPHIQELSDIAEWMIPRLRRMHITLGIHQIFGILAQVSHINQRQLYMAA